MARAQRGKTHSSRRVRLVVTGGITLMPTNAGARGGAMTQERQDGLAADARARAAFDPTVAHQARIYDYWLGRKVDVVHTLAGR